MVDETARTWRFCSVERHREEAFVLHPVLLVEGALEARGGLRQPLRALHVAELPVHCREAPFGVVDVALRLGERDRPLGRRAVVVQDGVERVAPALVAQPDARAALVLDEAVAVRVPGAVDPTERLIHGGGAHLEPIEVAGPDGKLGDQQQPQRRGIHGAVVRRVRHGARGGELAAPQLVHDLAGLLITEGVVDRALPVTQERDRRLRPAQVEEQRLETDEGHLAAERRREPRQSGERHPLPVDHRGQLAQVVLAAAQRPVELVVVGEDVGGVRLPALVLVPQRPVAGVELTAGLAGRAGSDDLDVVADGRVPAGWKVQPVPRPPLLDGLGAIVEVDDRLAGDLVEAEVGEREGAGADLRRKPLAATTAAAAADLEQVGEVRREVEVDDELHVTLVVVAHAQELVQPVGDEARAAHVNAGLRQGSPVRGARLQVGELHRRRVTAVGAGAEQHRLAAGDRDLVPAQVARVAVVQAEHGVLRPRHLPELVGVEEEVAFLDGKTPRATATHHVALGARGGHDGLVGRALARGPFWLFLGRAHRRGLRLSGSCLPATARSGAAGGFLPRRLEEQPHQRGAVVEEEAGHRRLGLPVLHRAAPADSRQRLADGERHGPGRVRACA